MDYIILYKLLQGGGFNKFKNEINEDVFESGNNYYIEHNHSNTTRINICS